MIRFNKSAGLAAVLSPALIVGCASTDERLERLEAELASTKAQNKSLSSSVGQLERDVANRDQVIRNLGAAPKPATSTAARPSGLGGDAEVPPNAKPGECYSRVFTPATYEQRQEQVLLSPASEKIEVVEAKYEWIEQKVLVKEASEAVEEVIPAEYKNVKEKVLVEPASYKLIEMPAKYEWVTEKVLVRPAYTTWKRGTGPIEKIDESTGEIMCLVEVPAEYKTVKKRVLKSAAGTRKDVIPAKYAEVTKRVLVKPPQIRKKVVPAQYKTVKVRKLIAPAQEKRIPIPAKYQKVTKKVKVAEGNLVWREIICETNTTADVVARVQKALKERGYNPGVIDGVIGSDTMRAVTKFQKDNGLASGSLTLNTLRALGVRT